MIASVYILTVTYVSNKDCSVWSSGIPESSP